LAEKGSLKGVFLGPEQLTFSVFCEIVQSFHFKKSIEYIADLWEVDIATVVEIVEFCERKEENEWRMIFQSGLKDEDSRLLVPVTFLHELAKLNENEFKKITSYFSRIKKGSFEELDSILAEVKEFHYRFQDLSPNLIFGFCEYAINLSESEINEKKTFTDSFLKFSKQILNGKLGKDELNFTHKQKKWFKAVLGEQLEVFKVFKPGSIKEKDQIILD